MAVGRLLGSFRGSRVGRYAGMTILAALDFDPLPAGLTATDAARIAAAIAARPGPGHPLRLRLRLAAWTRWCAARNIAPLPATPPRSAPTSPNAPQQGVSVPPSTLACAAIASTTATWTCPTRSGTRPSARSAAACAAPSAPHPAGRPDPSAPPRSADRRPTSTAAQPAGARDRALILLGYASALRRAELAALTLADLEHQPGGAAAARPPVQDRPGGPRPGRRRRPRPAPRHRPARRPRRLAGPPRTAARPAVHRLRHRRLATARRSPPPASHRKIVTRRARAAGLAAARITGHSLRAGHATTAAAGRRRRLTGSPPRPATAHLRSSSSATSAPCRGPGHHLQPRPRPVTGLRVEGHVSFREFPSPVSLTVARWPCSSRSPRRPRPGTTPPDGTSPRREDSSPDADCETTRMCWPRRPVGGVFWAPQREGQVLPIRELNGWQNGSVAIGDSGVRKSTERESGYRVPVRTGADLVERKILPVAVERYAESPVLLLEGPRTVGKSTLLAGLAERLGGEVLDLDDVDVRAAVARDPAVMIDAPGPVLIDEYQHAPVVLDAIKARLNRFEPTGAVRPDRVRAS